MVAESHLVHPKLVASHPESAGGASAATVPVVVASVPVAVPVVVVEAAQTFLSALMVKPVLQVVHVSVVA